MTTSTPQPGAATSNQAEAAAKQPDHRQTRSTGLGDLLEGLDRRLRTGDASDLESVPTGLPVLDDTIGGGLRPGEIVMLGGPPGVGKTIGALQIARNIARTGNPAVFICYEHEEATLALRLLALEAGEGGADDETSRRISNLLLQGARGQRGLADAVSGDPGLTGALERMRGYGDHLTLVRASGAHTAIEQIDQLIYEQRANGMPVVFVDYIQKVPVHPEPSTESEKVTRTIEDLKDLALTHRVPMMAISAVDAGGMEARRLRLHHLRGSSAIAFESDIIVMLNDKIRAISKIHLAYDSVGAHRFRDWVVWSIEKNRGGPNLIDLEFRKDFTHFRFDPDGGLVSEKLADERMDEELF